MRGVVALWAVVATGVLATAAAEDASSVDAVAAAISSLLLVIVTSTVLSGFLEGEDVSVGSVLTIFCIGLARQDIPVAGVSRKEIIEIKEVRDEIFCQIKEGCCDFF